MPDLNAALSQVEILFNNCKPLVLKEDTCACVTPSLTFAEFLFLLRGMKSWKPEAVEALALAKPVPSLLSPGDTTCPLIGKAGACSAACERGMTCRVHGLPESVRGGIARIEGMTAPERESQINPMRDRLAELNAGLHPFEAEPYFLDALTLHCWFAVLLDTGVTQPLFVELRKMASEILDLSHLQARYINHTMFKEKLDAIDLFFSLNESLMAKEAFECLKLIHDGFPLTGTYYRPQAIIYARFLQDILKNHSAA